MSSLEAWTVTALGMTVVFIGLVLCIVFIQISNRVASRIRWGDHPHAAAPAGGGAASVAIAAEADAAPAVAPLPGEVVDAGVIAVIAAVIEIEQRLYLGRAGARMTIRRPALLS